MYTQNENKINTFKIIRILKNDALRKKTKKLSKFYFIFKKSMIKMNPYFYV